MIQIESARQRLAKAAEVQARERAEGWVIVAVERKIEIECEGVTISGRIDRIERNERTGQVRVLDYEDVGYGGFATRSAFALAAL